MIISVALCTYNGERFIERQLKTILNQTLPVNEIVIFDDNSEDSTVRIIRELEEKYGAVIRLHINQPGLGVIKNFEKAIQSCLGDIIFLSDQDDEWEKNKVEVITNKFNQCQNDWLIFSNAQLIDEEGNTLPGTLWQKWGFTKEVQGLWKSNKLAFEELLEGRNRVTGATVAFRKELKKYIFPFDLPEYCWHDAWIAMIAAGENKMSFLEHCLTRYRIHPNQQVGVDTTRVYKKSNIFRYAAGIKIFYLFPIRSFKYFFHKTIYSFKR
ncbi:MAG TPA: glycosyltransferase family 2 protein [Chitinophagaceae bacterium]|nr:glycosyltransferase family 2 protein [Chitinophagaceae bacterium]